VGNYEGTKHSLGTALKDENVDDRTIAALFGHSDTRSVEPYAKIRPSNVRAALARVNCVSSVYPAPEGSQNEGVSD
jgi:hypothetical protein